MPESNDEARLPRARKVGGSLWNVYCDFDGTISTVDVTDSLLERFAAPSWLVIEDSWKRGLIGSRECMQQQVELIDATREEIEAHLDTIEIDPGFPAFVAECEQRDIPLIVLSDGIDFAIHHVLRRHRLHRLRVFSNQLRQVSERRFKLGFPNSRVSCESGSGMCKCAYIMGDPLEPTRSLLIGDGRSDFCGARAADLVFAKTSLLTFCQKQQLPHQAFSDFRQARVMLTRLLGSSVEASGSSVEGSG